MTVTVEPLPHPHRRAPLGLGVCVFWRFGDVFCRWRCCPSACTLGMMRNESGYVLYFAAEDVLAAAAEPHPCRFATSSTTGTLSPATCSAPRTAAGWAWCPPNFSRKTDQGTACNQSTSNPTAYPDTHAPRRVATDTPGAAAGRSGCATAGHGRTASRVAALSLRC